MGLKTRLEGLLRRKSVSSGFIQHSSGSKFRSGNKKSRNFEDKGGAGAAAEQRKKLIILGVLILLLAGVFYYQFGRSPSATPAPPPAPLRAHVPLLHHHLLRATHKVVANVLPPAKNKPKPIPTPAPAPAKPAPVAAPAPAPAASSPAAARCRPGTYLTAGGACVAANCPPTFTAVPSGCLAPGEVLPHSAPTPTPTIKNPLLGKCKANQYRLGRRCQAKLVLGKDLVLESSWDPSQLATCTAPGSVCSAPMILKLSFINHSNSALENVVVTYNAGCLTPVSSSVDLSTPFTIAAHSYINATVIWNNTAITPGIYSLQVGLSATVSPHYKLNFASLVGANSLTPILVCNPIPAGLIPDLSSSTPLWVAIK